MLDRRTFIEEIQNKGLYLMTKDDIPAFAECGASGYKDYPLFNYFCGGSYDDEKAIILWNFILRTLPKEAVCFSDSKDLKGFAIWMPGSCPETSIPAYLAGGALKLAFTFDFGIIGRLLRYETHAAHVRSEMTNNEGWYFYNLVTRADCQGQGIGGALVRPALALMDSYGEIAFLETHKDTNVPLYEHYGFELGELSTVPRTKDLIHRPMLRKPRGN